MDINNIISITVSVASPAVTRLGFGEPLIYGYNTNILASDVVKRYSTSTWSADLIDDGFLASDPVYLAAQAIAAQSPKPPTFKVCRATQTFDHDVDITCLTDTLGEQIVVSITGNDPSAAGSLLTETYTRTCTGGGIANEATELAGLITAGAWGAAGDITATGVGNDVQIRGQAGFTGEILYYDDLVNATIDDVTAVRTVATDLDAAFAADPDWYCLVAADAGTLDAIAIASWVQDKTNKIACLQTQDSDVITAGGGIAGTLSGTNQNQNVLIFSKHGLNEMPAAAMAGRFLPLDPGTEIWAFEALTGVTPSSLTTAESGYAHDNYCNTYEGIDIGGVEVVQGTCYGGWSSGSSETFIDTIRLIDAAVVEVQIQLLALFTASKKVPFNDAGIGQVKAAILDALQGFEGDAAGFEPNSAFVEVPRAADVSAVDKAARQLPDVVFGATLNGAIRKVIISATLSY